MSRTTIEGFTSCRETHFSSRLDVKFGQSQWSRPSGHGECLKSVSRTITCTLQDFMLAASKVLTKSVESKIELS